jgi:ABC-type molybdate transport system substrate-binding protein
MPCMALPLNRRMVFLKTTPASAKQFYDYVVSAYAKNKLTRYGFSLPR